MSEAITTDANVIDSRDVIARIEALQAAEGSLSQPDRAELDKLVELAGQAEGCSDWVHGEMLIRENYFVEHTKQLVDDCYEMPKEMTKGDWPYRHRRSTGRPPPKN